MKTLCNIFKKDKVMPKKPKETNNRKSFSNFNRKIVQRKKSKLQIRTGKNLTIIPISYNPPS